MKARPSFLRHRQQAFGPFELSAHLLICFCCFCLTSAVLFCGLSLIFPTPILTHAKQLAPGPASVFHSAPGTHLWTLRHRVRCCQSIQIVSSLSIAFHKLRIKHGTFITFQKKNPVSTITLFFFPESFYFWYLSFFK